jgi:hypothetical protein
MLHDGGAKLTGYAEGKVVGKVKGATEVAPSQLVVELAGSTGFEPATSGLTVERKVETIGCYRSLFARIQLVTDHLSGPIDPVVPLCAR